MFADFNESHHEANLPENEINPGQSKTSTQGEISDLADLKSDSQKQKTQQYILLAGLLFALVITLVWLIAARIMNQKSVPLLIEIGSLYQSSGKSQDAIRIFDEAVTIGISDSGMQGRVGEMYRQLKEYDKSIELLNRALASEPNNETYRLSLARSLTFAGRCQDAIPEFLRLINIKPNSYTYSAGLVACYQSQGEYDAAHTEVNRCISIVPTNYQPYLLKGDLYRGQGKWVEAIAQYQKAIEINPQSYTVHINMGFSYIELRDYTTARTEFLAASVIDPNRPEPYYYAAESYIGQGNFDAAVPFYEQALEADDQYFLALLGLGKTYAAKDECSLAIPYFRKVLALNLGNEDATQGLNNCTQTP